MNIIFDFDGVIINSHKVKTSAFYNVFKVYGELYGLKAKKFHLEHIGKSRYFKFKYILKNILKSKVTKKKISNLDKEFDYFVQKRIKKMYPSHHLIRFLKNKNNLFNIYISTGTPQGNIVKTLKEKKILKYFYKVYGSPKSKTNHIKDIKKNNKKNIFIGDSFEDFKAAKNSNIEFILKINSENLFLRKKINLNTINSFKFLEKKIQLLK
jgi:beta-phosphoglucomutase